jgi:uncharacterized MAPEG superfamily protein
MTREQRIVAVGAGSGVLVMLAALFLLSRWLPGLIEGAEAGERLAFAARWNALAALPLFIAIAAVGNQRFKSEAIDPTRGAESRAMVIDGRVVDNTLQQYVMFAAANFSLSASATGEQLGMVPAGALIFVAMRVAFWIGYRTDPLSRAFGMAGTSYLSLVLFSYSVLLAWT